MPTSDSANPLMNVLHCHLMGSKKLQQLLPCHDKYYFLLQLPDHGIGMHQANLSFGYLLYAILKIICDFALPELPRFVVINTTPLAPREP